MNSLSYLFVMSVFLHFHISMTMEGDLANKELPLNNEELTDELVDAEKIIVYIEQELWLAGISLISQEPKKNYLIVSKNTIEEKLRFTREKLNSKEKDLIPFQVTLNQSKPNAVYYIDEKHLNNAARGFARYHLRMVQDEACCYYESYRIKRLEENLELQDFAQAIKKYMPEEKLNTIYLEQIIWAQKMTCQNKLPDPNWIMKFSDWDKKMEMMPHNAWQQARSGALEYFKLKIEPK